MEEKLESRLHSLAGVFIGWARPQPARERRAEGGGATLRFNKNMRSDNNLSIPCLQASLWALPLLRLRAPPSLSLKLKAGQARTWGFERRGDG
jgi:hypothetical protein